MATPVSAPLSDRLTMRGPSAWQCGHQWATNRISVGLPVGPTVVDVPSKVLPVTVGMAWPTAGSFADETKSGKAVPCTFTGATSVEASDEDGEGGLASDA